MYQILKGSVYAFTLILGYFHSIIANLNKKIPNLGNTFYIFVPSFNVTIGEFFF